MSQTIQFPQGPIVDPQTGYVSLEWFEWFQNPQILSLVVGTALDPASGGTGIISYTVGDIIYASAATTLSKLAIAAAGKIIRSNGTLPVYSTSTWPDTLNTNGVLHEGIGANNVITRTSFTFDGSALQVAADAVASDMSIKVEHTGTGGGSAAFVATGANGGGDTKNVWTSTGTQSWAAGLDASASSAWKLSASANLGTNDAISVSTAGVVSFPAAPLPAGSGGTGLTSLGTGVATFLGTPSSANLAAALTDETGTDKAVFSDSPVFTTKISVPDGSAAAPSVKVGDEQNGLASIVANSMSLVANGRESLRATATVANGNYLSVDSATNGIIATSTGSATNCRLELYSKGAALLQFGSEGGTSPAFRVNAVGSAIATNGILFAPAAATGSPTLFVGDLGGTGDTNIGFGISSAGSGSVNIYTNTSGTRQVEIYHTASATNRLQFTGSNGGNPTINVSGGNLAITPNVVCAATVNTGGYTVATLPTGVLGMRAYVTDATGPTFLTALVGGGAVKCPAFYDGTNWVAG